MQQTVNLTAGNRSRLQIAGRTLVIVSTGAVTGIELWVMRGSEELEYLRTAPRGMKLRLLDGGYTHVELRAAADTTVELVLSANGSIDYDFVTGTQVQATIAGLPLPVQNDRGTPGNLMYVTGVSITDAPATSAPDNAAVACSSTQAQIVAANAARRQVTITNLGPDACTLGSAGITWAKRCIVLEAGDSYVEDRAGNLAWWAICDTAKTASVTSKEVLA